MYKKILSGYVNDSKKSDGKYLSITNNSEEDVVIKAGKSIFLNMTPKEVRDKNPGVPMFSKSVKVEEEPTKESHSVSEQVSNDIPF